MAFSKGYIPWNKGKKNPAGGAKVGSIPWNKGLKGYLAGEKHWSWGKTRTDMVGNNNPNWKGGITKPNKLYRFRFRELIQKTVFERDNYTCQICGEKGCALQVDHIQKWSEYVEGRFDIFNCRTLCVKCHYKITFGYDMPKNVKTWGLNLKYLREVA